MKYSAWTDIEPSPRVLKSLNNIHFFFTRTRSDNLAEPQRFLASYNFDLFTKKLRTCQKCSLFLILLYGAEDFLINGRFSVGSSDRHNVGSHRCNLICLVCYCTNEQGQSIGNPQLTIRVSSSTSFSEREGFKKKKK